MAAANRTGPSHPRGGWGKVSLLPTFSIAVVLAVILSGVPEQLTVALVHTELPPSPSGPDAVAPGPRSPPVSPSAPHSPAALSAGVPSSPRGSHSPVTSWCQIPYLPLCPRSATVRGAVPTPASSAASSWVNLTPAAPPSSYPMARAYAGSDFDPDAQQVLLFGGLTYGFGLFNDLWGYSHGNWSELAGPTTCAHVACPPARFAPGFAYDLNDHEAVLFGGLNLTATGFVALNDTWVYSNGAWSNLTATAGAAPSPRYYAAMSYASAEGYVLLFGGTNLSGAIYGDTWTFSHGTWTNLTAKLPQTPEARSGAII
ncbi:MAG: hypothetical protein L3J91_01930, partial [Thermoplasmata archaeon]|nr:hypothetical protein [Thermoplasmata archaeon]